MKFNVPAAGLELTTGRCGEIFAVSCRSREYCVPAAEAFTLLLLDKEGNELLLESSKFEFNNFVYTRHPALPELVVELKIACDQEFVRFRPVITNVPENQVISWFDGPQLCYPRHKNITLLQPLHDGVLLDEPLPGKNYHPIGFAKLGVTYGSFYPGRSQMQFMAIYADNESGVYFAAHDPAGATKAVEYEYDESKVRLSLQTFTGGDFGSDYRPDWDYVIGGFGNSWQGAAEIYRNWYDNSFPLADKAVYPQWMKESPLVMIYPVRGHGRDTGEMEPNCYYPYTNMLQWVDKFNARLGAPVMALPMHWEGTAPWAPPFVWPPFGGEENFAEFCDELHKKGNLLGVYCSGTAWTCRSSIIKEYAPGCTPEQEKMMLRGPKGELDATVCCGEEFQRLGYDLCLTEEPARSIVKEEILKLARANIDYAQFFDQNHGGCVHNCFARDHHHPPVPGAWQIAMQREFFEEVLSEIAAGNKNMILGCESSAADTYVKYLPFNDARSSFMVNSGTVIPLQQYVLHGRSCNFSGNQGGTSWCCDFDRSPYSLNRRLAFSFCAGDVLSVLLKENGNIHWCWGYEWSKPAPDQELVWKLLKNLNDCRRANPEFLLYGRMMPDFRSVSGETLNEYTPEGTPRPFPAFYHSSWQAADGAKAAFAVNYLDKAQTLTVDKTQYTLPPCSVCKLDADGKMLAVYGK